MPSRSVALGVRNPASLTQLDGKDSLGGASVVAAEVPHHDALEPAKEGAADDEDAQTTQDQSLPRGKDRLTLPIIIVLVVGGLERAAFYAVSTPWQNYMQNSAGDRSPPGALGLGQAKATAISNAYMVFSALTPVPFAIVADLWLGRHQTLLISLSLTAIGCSTQLITSLPFLLRQGAGSPGLAVSMIMIGLGTGGVKAVFPPFLADQHQRRDSRVVQRADGTRRLIDSRLTLLFIYNVYYAVTNIACLSTVPSTLLEKAYGFWTAFTLATAGICMALAFLLGTSFRLVKVTPGDNILVPAAKVLSCAMRNGFSLNRAKSSYQLSRSLALGEVSTGHLYFHFRMQLISARLSFAVFYLCANQMSNNLVSQAGQMQLSGVPNDMIPTFASVACVLLAPLLQALWDFLARHKITFSAVLLIEVSFVLCAVAIGFASLTQHLIYLAPPCFDRPRTCQPGGEPNRISVWVQIPTYLIAALAETIGFVTASEYAYSHSPVNAKSMIQALSQLAAALGSILGLATSPAARDPWLVIYYGALAGGMLLAAIMFWWLFGIGRRGELINDS